MHKEYAKVAVCVFPSIWENFPNVCLEAMSAGRGIAASWNGGMAEMLDAGHCGLPFPPNSPQRLAQAVSDQFWATDVMLESSANVPGRAYWIDTASECDRSAARGNL